ncbi:MAG TPA: twin-arginine translocase TatA/TatE family subunit [Opitutales bacterium]|nr:twin-arginine translocase TatA/TatE family subunit [Opitutales bacterium]
MSLLSPAFAFLSLSSGDIILIMFICLLMFGSKKLPELAKAMGQSMKEFKKAANEVEDNFRSAVQDDDRKKEDDRRRAEEERRRSSPASSSQSEPAEKR